MVPHFADAERVVALWRTPKDKRDKGPASYLDLEEWRAQSPCSKFDDFVFPSLIKDGMVPIRASTFVQGHLRPAAISAGVTLAKGQRFGLHNLSHSLAHIGLGKKP